MKVLLVLAAINLTISCRVPRAQANIDTEIIGTWISNDDELWKINFNSSGQKTDYYENEIIDTSTYYITSTCGGYTRTNNELFLKAINSNNIETCELLNNIHTDDNGVKTLSVTTERGKLLLFTKE